MKKVLVLGCGPAGLLAAHAAHICGTKVTIISRKQRSYIAGAQFLHAAIPELTNDEGEGVIHLIKKGTKEEYARKIYGDADAKTSWDLYEEGQREVWNLTWWYATLWDRYEHMITDGLVAGEMMHKACEEFDAVLSTVPLPAMFPAGEYLSETVQIVQGEGCAAPMTIIYNGEPEIEWYRTSALFGYSSMEYPYRPSRVNCVTINKPLRSTPPLLRPNFHPLGRYGKWQKGVLVDDAFREALQIVEEL